MNKLIYIVGSDIVSRFQLQVKLKQSGKHHKTVCFDNTDAALENLIRDLQDLCEFPDMLILNVLGMTRRKWDFLQTFNGLSHRSAKTIKYMVTPFENEKSIEVVGKRYGVSKLYYSPLNSAMIREILEPVFQHSTADIHAS